MIWVAIAVGGAAGSAARYGVERVIRTGSAFPWSTFFINVTGCLLIGLVTVRLVERYEAPAWLRAGLLVGVLGGYTTFSTFGIESYTLLDARKLGVALAYTAGSVCIGILAVYAGVLLGRAL